MSRNQYNFKIEESEYLPYVWNNAGDSRVLEEEKVNYGSVKECGQLDVHTPPQCEIMGVDQDKTSLTVNISVPLFNDFLSRLLREREAYRHELLKLKSEKYVNDVISKTFKTYEQKKSRLTEFSKKYSESIVEKNIGIKKNDSSSSVVNEFSKNFVDNIIKETKEKVMEERYMERNHSSDELKKFENNNMSNKINDEFFKDSEEDEDEEEEGEGESVELNIVNEVEIKDGGEEENKNDPFGHFHMNNGGGNSDEGYIIM